MKTKIVILSSVVLVLFAINVRAADILSYDFDSSIPNYLYGYTYEENNPDNGAPTHDNGTVAATGGVGGTGGFVATFDMTLANGGWAGFGAGFGDWNGAGNYALIANASSLADITFQMDARADGLTGNSAGVTFELKFEAADDTITPPDGDGDTDVLLTLQTPATLTSSFQTFTSTLDSWTVANGTFEQLQTFLAGVENINLNIGYGAGGDLPDFGNDAGNILSADNYMVAVVPEPSTLALFGLGGMIMLLRRRK